MYVIIKGNMYSIISSIHILHVGGEIRETI